MTSIKEQLLADQAEQQKSLVMRRCGTCRAVDSLDPDARAEYEEIMPDKSFNAASIARWLTANTDHSVTEESVSKHRRNHIS